MALTGLVSGHESGNAHYLAENGAAVICRSTSETVAQVRRLMNDSQALDALARAAGELYRPGLQTVVADIRKQLGC